MFFFIVSFHCGFLIFGDKIESTVIIYPKSIITWDRDAGTLNTPYPMELKITVAGVTKTFLPGGMSVINPKESGCAAGISDCGSDAVCQLWACALYGVIGLIVNYESPPTMYGFKWQDSPRAEWANISGSLDTVNVQILLMRPREILSNIVLGSRTLKATELGNKEIDLGGDTTVDLMSIVYSVSSCDNSRCYNCSSEERCEALSGDCKFGSNGCYNYSSSCRGYCSELKITQAGGDYFPPIKDGCMCVCHPALNLCELPGQYPGARVCNGTCNTCPDLVSCSNSRCYINNGGCFEFDQCSSTACTSCPNHAACVASSGCRWGFNESKCHRVCNTSHMCSTCDEEACPWELPGSGCQWENGACVDKTGCTRGVCDGCASDITCEKMLDRCKYHCVWTGGHCENSSFQCTEEELDQWAKG